MEKRKSSFANQKNLLIGLTLVGLLTVGLFGLFAALTPQPAADQIDQGRAGIRPTPRGFTPVEADNGAIACDPAKLQRRIDLNAEMGLPLQIACTGEIVLNSPLLIRGDVQIVGSGALPTTFNGQGYAEQLFTLTDGSSLTLRQVQLFGAHRWAVYVTPGAELVADGVVFLWNGSGAHSGAIHNEGGSVILRGVAFANNQGGTAIHNAGDLYLSDTAFDDSATRCTQTNSASLHDPQGLCAG